MKNPSPESVQIEMPERVPVAFLAEQDVLVLNALAQIAKDLHALPTGIETAEENLIIRRELPGDVKNN